MLLAENDLRLRHEPAGEQDEETVVALRNAKTRLEDAVKATERSRDHFIIRVIEEHQRAERTLCHAREVESELRGMTDLNRKLSREIKSCNVKCAVLVKMLAELTHLSRAQIHDDAQNAADMVLEEDPALSSDLEMIIIE